MIAALALEGTKVEVIEAIVVLLNFGEAIRASLFIAIFLVGTGQVVQS